MTSFRIPLTLLVLAIMASACATSPPESPPESAPLEAAPAGEEAAGEGAGAEVTDWPVPDPADVESIDGLIAAYYEVVSGPAGEARDWDRDKSLHVPDADVIITRTGEDGEMAIDRLTISGYHERSGAVAASAFYEYEIHRVVQQHGSTVHVWSTYEWRSEPEGPVGGQGVNSIEAIWDGTRYWITSWTYDGRPDAPPVSAEYLP